MSVTIEDVISSAKLANLHIDEDKISDFQNSMNEILKMLEQISSVNTDKVQHLSILPTKKLEDYPEHNPDQNQDLTASFENFAIEIDPLSKEFLVPQVIDEE